MVELRWITRTSLAKTVNDFDITFQVLQYRYQIPQITGGLDLLVVRSHPDEWSEWIDVPTVKEE